LWNNLDDNFSLILFKTMIKTSARSGPVFESGYSFKREKKKFRIQIRVKVHLIWNLGKQREGVGENAETKPITASGQENRFRPRPLGGGWPLGCAEQWRIFWDGGGACYWTWTVTFKTIRQSYWPSPPSPLWLVSSDFFSSFLLARDFFWPLPLVNEARVPQDCWLLPGIAVNIPVFLLWPVIIVNIPEDACFLFSNCQALHVLNRLLLLLYFLTQHDMN